MIKKINQLLIPKIIIPLLLNTIINNHFALANNKVHTQNKIKYQLIPMILNENLDPKSPYQMIRLWPRPLNIYASLYEQARAYKDIPKEIPTIIQRSAFTWSHGFFENAGISLIDINQDGWLDIFSIVNGNPFIYLNKKNGYFNPPFL